MKNTRKKMKTTTKEKEAGQATKESNKEKISVPINEKASDPRRPC